MLCVNDFEEYARKHLDKNTWDFFIQGVEREDTFQENFRAFTRYQLIPRMLRNTPMRDISTTVLGEKVPLPFGIAPSACQKLAHPDGELAAASAASEMGAIYTLSAVSSTSLEDVAKAAGGVSHLWMQMYILTENERRHTVKMVKRAEASGYKALVLTVDSPVLGLQLRMWRNQFKLPPHFTLPNLFDASEGIPKNRHSTYFCSTLTWKDVEWLKSITKLPIILKGILTVEDAVQAARVGAAAVWISNHGGRQLDGVNAAIDVLPAISSALSATDCEVYVDGGVRWGTDILKALALGARYVFIGRPAVWGLVHSGKDGAQRILEILKSELDRAMHLAGCKDIGDIGPHLVKKIDHSRL